MIKIQLILLADETTNPSLIKDQDLSGYARVDLLYWGIASDLVRNYNEWRRQLENSGTQVLLHQVNMSVEHHIDQFVDKTCQYFLVSENLTDLDKFPKALTLYSRSDKLALIRPPAANDYNGFVGHAPLYRFLEQWKPENNYVENVDLLRGEEIKGIFSSLEDFYRYTAVSEEENAGS